MRIFLTGASGCIGHDLAKILIEETGHELFFLVRNPAKLQFDYKARSGINIIPGDLLEIEKFADVLKTIDTAILAATAWGAPKVTFEVNVVQTLALMNLLDPEKCQQVIYFSTASILGQNNQLLPEAGRIGTDYIRTKYECFTQLKKLAIAPKITTVFPTLVLGGGENQPYSHLTAGFPEVIKWMNLIRWFKADGSFHFIHTRDIAQVVRYLVDHPQAQSSQLVLGNAPTTANQAIAEICHYLHKPIYFQIPLSITLANFFIKIFRIQMAEWDRFCLNYRHFTYQNPVNPATFGLKSYYPTITDFLRIII